MAFGGFASGSGHVAGQVPTTVNKRKILHAKESSPDQLVGVAKDLAAAEHYADALSFLERANKPEEIDALSRKSVEIGDLFLYEACCRARNRNPETAELGRLADEAAKLGKLHFARKAYRLSGRQDKAEEVERQLTALTGGTPETAASVPPGAGAAPGSHAQA